MQVLMRTNEMASCVSRDMCTWVDSSGGFLGQSAIRMSKKKFWYLGRFLRMIETGDFYDGVKLDTGPGGSCFMAQRLWWANRVSYFICNLTEKKRSKIVNTGRSFMHIINLHATLSDLTMHIVPLSCHAGEIALLLPQGRRATLGEILRRSIKGKVISS